MTMIVVTDLAQLRRLLIHIQMFKLVSVLREAARDHPTQPSVCLQYEEFQSCTLACMTAQDMKICPRGRRTM